MANIKIELGHPVINGMPLSFKAPCNCNEITGLKVCFPNGEDMAFILFSFADAHGNDLNGIGNLFAKDAMVRVILDTSNAKAYIQNADTNAYIEETFVKSVNGQKPNKLGNVNIEVSGGNGGDSSEFGGEMIFSKEINPDNPADDILSFAVNTRLIPGKWYTVNYNGKDYFCRCRSYDSTGGLTLIGDHVGANDAEGIDPFVVWDDPDEGTYNIYVREPGYMTITTGRTPIYEVGDQYVTVDDLAAGKKVVYETFYENTIAFESGDKSVDVADLDLKSLTPGETYRVTWNGKVYDCVLKKELFDGDYYTYYLGDESIGRGGDGVTGHPFCLRNLATFRTVSKNSDVEEVVQFSIAKPVERAVGSAFVKSVNGTTPDKNGNVEIKIPESGQAAALSTKQINALDALFKAASYLKDVSAEYAAFCDAFGLVSPDVPDEPSEDVAEKIDFEAVKSGTVAFYNDGGLNLSNWANRATLVPIGYYLTKGKTYRFSLGGVSNKYHYGVQIYIAETAGLTFPHEELPTAGYKYYEGVIERIVDTGWKNTDYTYTPEVDNCILGVNFKNNANSDLDESNYAEILENFVVEML